MPHASSSSSPWSLEADAGTLVRPLTSALLCGLFLFFSARAHRHPFSCIFITGFSLFGGLFCWAHILPPFFLKEGQEPGLFFVTLGVATAAVGGLVGGTAAILMPTGACGAALGTLLGLLVLMLDNGKLIAAQSNGLGSLSSLVFVVCIACSVFASFKAPLLVRTLALATMAVYFLVVAVDLQLENNAVWTNSIAIMNSSLGKTDRCFTACGVPELLAGWVGLSIVTALFMGWLNGLVDRVRTRGTFMQIPTDEGDIDEGKKTAAASSATAKQRTFTFPKNTAYNLFDPDHMPPALEAHQDILVQSAQELLRIFGFQLDNVRNQTEHLVLLLANVRDAAHPCSLLASSNQNIGSGMDSNRNSADGLADTSTTGSINSGGGGYSALSASAIAGQSLRRQAAGVHGAGPGVSKRTKVWLATQQLHEKLFANYKTWCKRLGISPHFSALGRPTTVREHMSSEEGAKLFARDMLLWLFIWGEAANLRHMPECICFLYHKLMQDLLTKTTHDQMYAGFFLDHVVTPVYEMVQKSMSAPKDHRNKLNYDDFNEFFWDPQCLRYHYHEASAMIDVSPAAAPAQSRQPRQHQQQQRGTSDAFFRAESPDELNVGTAERKSNSTPRRRSGEGNGQPHVGPKRSRQKNKGKKKNKDRNVYNGAVAVSDLSYSDGEDEQDDVSRNGPTSASSAAHLASQGVRFGNAIEEPAVAIGLSKARKTYLEKRSWIHPLFSLHRIFEWHVITFQFLVCCAFSEYLLWDLSYQVMITCGVFLTINILGIFWVVFEVWVAFPNAYITATSVCGFLLRLFARFTLLVYQVLYFTWAISGKTKGDSSGTTIDADDDELPDAHDDPDNDNGSGDDTVSSADDDAAVQRSLLEMSFAAGTSGHSFADVGDSNFWFWQFIWLSLLGLSVYILESLVQLWPGLISRLYLCNNDLVQAFINICFPISQLYVGKSMHENKARLVFYYIAFWVSLLAFKFWFSYVFEVSPGIIPSVELWDDYRNMQGSSPLATAVLILMRWGPHFMVYLIDISIWYAVWTSIVGAIVGLLERQGEIRDFEGVRRSFISMPNAFCEKLVSPARLDRGMGSHASILDVPAVSSPFNKTAVRGAGSAGGVILPPTAAFSSSSFHAQGLGLRDASATEADSLVTASTTAMSPPRTRASSSSRPWVQRSAQPRSSELQQQQLSQPSESTTVASAATHYGGFADMGGAGVSRYSPPSGGRVDAARHSGAQTGAPTATGAESGVGLCSGPAAGGEDGAAGSMRDARADSDSLRDLDVGVINLGDESGLADGPQQNYYQRGATTNGSYGRFLDVRTRRWVIFARVWNQIVQNLRDTDFVSDEEVDLLKFHKFDFLSRPVYLPVFQTAGVVETVTAIAQRSAAAFQAEPDPSQKMSVMTQLNEDVRANMTYQETVYEVWEMTSWVLEELCGPAHAGDVQQISGCVAHWAEQGVLLERLNLDMLPNLLTNLSKLVQALNNGLKKRKPRASGATGGTVPPTSTGTGLPEAEPNFGASPLRADGQAGPTDGRETGSSGGVGGKGMGKKSVSASFLAALVGEGEHAEDEQLLSQGHGDASDDDNLGPEDAGHARGSRTQVHKQHKRARKYKRLKPMSRKREQHDSARDAVRDQLRGVLATIRTALGASAHESARDLADRIMFVMRHERGFFWDDLYASQRLDLMGQSERTRSVLRKLHGLLTIQASEAQPSSPEANRRLCFFANSLFMDLPAPPPIAEMCSFTTLTPYYGEDVLLSKADLERKNSDGLSTLLYLQTLHRHEWNNFMQRLGLRDEASIWRTEEHAMATRMWASLRAQTLYRTVEGMMYNSQALGMLAETEGLSEFDAEIVLRQKYSYVVTCQIYGRMKRNQDPKADDIEGMLHRHPLLRVAYIDEVKARDETSHYSVLIKSDGGGGISEIYRVKLPGNPVLGEGKPENQNHAVIFTRGCFLQAIDMNQDGYLEEALKARNLLEEFYHDIPPSASSSAPSPHKAHHHHHHQQQQQQEGNDQLFSPTVILGFREHVFTGAVSSLANYMALQETTFVSLGQRMLDHPLRVRQHYGHPDMFDKLFVMTRGGMSKASKGINLSEDIFAGFNSTLRGGASRFVEYIQVGKGRDVGMQQIYKFEAKLSSGNAEQSLSRDINRLGERYDFFRLLSFYFGGLGHYLTVVLTMVTLRMVVYTLLFLALFHAEHVGTRPISPEGTLQLFLGAMGLLNTLPLLATLTIERGLLAAVGDILQVLISGGPLYFLFHIQTKAHYFAHTIVAGGSRYRATGRGFVTRHSPFDENFRFFATSHLYLGLEIAMALVLVGVYSQAGQYAGRTWALWLAAAAFLFSPFWFNPLSFEWSNCTADYSAWLRWMMERGGSANKSWEVWWLEENSHLQRLSPWWAILLVLKNVGTPLLIAFGLFGGSTFFSASNHELARVIKVVLLFGAIVLGYWLVETMHLRLSYALGRVLSILLGAAFCIGLIVLLAEHTSYWRMTLAMYYAFGGVSYLLLTLGVRGVVAIYRIHDLVLGHLLFAVLFLFSLLRVPSYVQTWLLYHNALSAGVVVDDLLKHARRSREGADEADRTIDTLQQRVQEQDRMLRTLHNRLSGKRRRRGVDDDDDDDVDELEEEEAAGEHRSLLHSASSGAGTGVGADTGTGADRASYGGVSKSAHTVVELGRKQQQQHGNAAGFTVSAIQPQGGGSVASRGESTMPQSQGRAGEHAQVAFSVPVAPLPQEQQQQQQTRPASGSVDSVDGAPTF